MNRTAPSRSEWMFRQAALLWGSVLLSACGAGVAASEAPDVRTQSASLVSSTPVRGAWSPTLKVQFCDIADWSCEPNYSALRQCGPEISGESHAPNTLDACEDGSQCGGGLSVAVDSIKVYTEDRTQLTQGRQATLEVQLANTSSANGASLDIYFTSDASHPQWTLLTTQPLTSSSPQVFTVLYTIPPGARVQAVRAATRYTAGAPVPCTTGPLDDRDDLAFTTAPPYVNGSPVKQLAAGANYTLALRQDGTLWAWGSSFRGVLGAAPIQHPWPSQSLVLSDVTGIASTQSTAFAIRADGTVWAWGENVNGLLGENGASSPSSVMSPLQVTGLSSVIALSAGPDFILALKSNGSVWAWGNNASGQLGDGTTVARTRPVRVAGLTDVTAISAGAAHGLALRGNGTVWAWGSNFAGELGDGTRTSRATAMRVPGIGNVTSISTSGSSVFAIRGSRDLWGWGYAEGGRLGDGEEHAVGDGFKTTPALSYRFPGGDDAVVLGAGIGGLAVERNGGVLWTWGFNASGNLCQGHTGRVLSPTVVQGFAGVTGSASGWLDSFVFTVFSRADGSVWGCGNNLEAQLGLGSTSPWSTSTPLKSLLP